MKVLLRTFGCRANQYDSEGVRALIEGGGHEIVTDARDADAAVFNSCAVTTQAESELRKAVRHAARQNPALRTTIMGCASGLELKSARRTLRELPTVTALVDGADLTAVGTALGMAPSSQSSSHQSGTRALLRIQDGCDEHCTFCATTMARGANRSRPIAALVEEAARLAAHHPEIVLTGIHIGTYGRDLGVGTSLSGLVERLIRAIPSVRFRLTSIEATEIDAQLAELMVGEPARLAPSIHAPLQSGAAAVLKRMGRHWYTPASYARALERIAARMPVLGLGADVIAGFPGETADDHRATCALIRSLPFTYLHVFPFSLRPDSAAQRLSGSLAPAIVAERAAELRAIGAEQSEAYARARHGGSADVIVIGAGGSPRQEGMTEDYLAIDLADGRHARGSRFAATLDRVGGRLVANPAVPASSTA